MRYALLLFLAVAAHAQTCSRPWTPTNPDGNYIVPGSVGGMVYHEAGGRKLALDAYAPPGRGPHPAVVVIHGGDWKAGSRVAYVPPVLELLARAGFAWFSVDYSLEPASPLQAQEDVSQALKFIRCHAPKLRVDPARIALLGEDTGAILAMLEAVENPRQYRGIAVLGGKFPEQRQGLFQPTGGPPPMLVVHGTADRDVTLDTAMKFCADVRAGKGRCLFYVIEGAIHRFENWRPEHQHYRPELIRWLRERLGVKTAPPEPRWASTGIGLLKDIEYAPGLKLDAWIPGDPDRKVRAGGPHPAVVIVHGGGWEAGDKTTYVAPLFEPLARAGFAWFSIDYRLTPAFRNSDQLDDVRNAMRFVRQNAARFNIDPKRIALLGESAGGQIVTQLACTPCDGCRPDAVVSLYGVYDLLPIATEGGGRSILSRLFGMRELDDAARAAVRAQSPLYNISPGMPPMLLLQGSADRLHSQAQAYSDALKKARVRHEVFTLDGAPHGLENWEGRPEWQAWKKKLVEFLRSYHSQHD